MGKTDNFRGQGWPSAFLLMPAMFKPVPGGWAYRSPTWGFGDTPHFLVNEAQKAQIEAVILPRRPILLAAVLIIGYIAWLLTLATLNLAFGRDPVNAMELLPLLVARPIALWIQKRRLQPILAGLPLTDERITNAEMRPLFAGGMYFLAFGVLLALTVPALVQKHYALSGLLAFLAIVVGLLAVRWYRVTLPKAGEK